jgi:ribosomal-protein-serine acetyltransferase
MRWEIRRATVDDLVAIRAEQDAFWGRRDLDVFHHPLLVREFGETAFVVEDADSAVLAYLFGLLTPRHVGYCHLVAVREGHRRRGFARALYDRFERVARASGAESLKAFTRPQNRSSIAFHTSIGFTAREVADYVGPGQTRTVFDKPLKLAARPSPPPHARLDSGAELRPLRLADAEALHRAIEANRERLARWMPWAAERTRDIYATMAFVERSVRGMEAGEDLQAALLRDGEIVGMVGFVGVSLEHRSTAIGYWLADSEQGRGTMTQAVDALVREAFARWGMERVEIRVATGNTRSRAIPERLGFTAEGTLRHAHRVGGRTLDEVVYSLLAAEQRGLMSN